jgi:translation initiation factor RLI1
MTNRIAIVDPNKCNPAKCKKECIKFCPPQSRGIEVINIINIDIEDINKNSLNTDKLTKKTNCTNSGTKLYWM